MRSRFLVLAAVIWAAVYIGVYFAVVSSQGNSPAWWYVALLAAGAGSLAFAAAGRWRRQQPLLLGVACLGLAALAGALSIGLLLIPAVVAAAVAAGRPAWHP
jgi:hypothetical protein